MRLLTTLLVSSAALSAAYTFGGPAFVSDGIPSDAAVQESLDQRLARRDVLDADCDEPPATAPPAVVPPTIVPDLTPPTNTTTTTGDDLPWCDEVEDPAPKCDADDDDDPSMNRPPGYYKPTHSQPAPSTTVPVFPAQHTDTAPPPVFNGTVPTHHDGGGGGGGGGHRPTGTNTAPAVSNVTTPIITQAPTDHQPASSIGGTDGGRSMPGSMPVKGHLLIDTLGRPDGLPSDFRTILDKIDKAKPGGFKFGNLGNPNLKAGTQAYDNAKIFNLFVAGNECKMGPTEPQPGVFHMDPCKAVQAFAKEMDAEFRFHNLMWHAQRPNWLMNAKFSTDDYINTIIPRHIKGVLEAVGQVWSTDVFNEPLADIGGPVPDNVVDCVKRSNRWPMWTEDDSKVPLFTDLSWMEEATKQAKAVGTGGQLLVNDYNIGPDNTKTECAIKLFEYLKPFGMDGIGFEMHISASAAVSRKSLQDVFDKVDKLGGKVAITELDVPVDGNSALLPTQALLYGEVLDACLYAPNCNTFLVWGINDNESWLNKPGKADQKALLFSDGKPKDGLYEMHARLKHYADAL